MESKDIRKVGLKITLPRVKILEVLESSSSSHMTAEDIYRHLLGTGDDIGLATIYRVLSQFETAGLVCKHNFEGGQAVYEIERGEHHDHIVCLSCGKVVEFVDKEIEARQHKIALEKDFSLMDHALVLYGKCANCRDGDDQAG